jgi:hypothetical protein
MLLTPVFMLRLTPANQQFSNQKLQISNYPSVANVDGQLVAQFNHIVLGCSRFTLISQCFLVMSRKQPELITRNIFPKWLILIR